MLIFVALVIVSIIGVYVLPSPARVRVAVKPRAERRAVGKQLRD
jgi:hypothetical protein